MFGLQQQQDNQYMHTKWLIMVRALSSPSALCSHKSTKLCTESFNIMMSVAVIHKFIPHEYRLNNNYYKYNKQNSNNTSSLSEPDASLSLSEGKPLSRSPSTSRIGLSMNSSIGMALKSSKHTTFNDKNEY